MKRLLVTGSRNWTDSDRIMRELDAAVDVLWPTDEPPHETIVLVHGDARGADRLAAVIWTSRWSMSTEPHPADWTQHGKRAGYLRNAEMVEAGADLCLAFILNGSKGATMCADLAENAGIPVRRFEVTS